MHPSGNPFGASSAMDATGDNAGSRARNSGAYSPPVKQQQLMRSSASFHSDRAVHDGAGFFAFALSQSASPLGIHPPHPTCMPPLTPGDPPGYAEHNLPNSPDDIMQRVHDNNLDAAAAALESFSLKQGAFAHHWRADDRTSPEEDLMHRQPQWQPQPRVGHMMHPRAQSWPPVGTHAPY